ncbi:hypothetical protein TIFTF001_016695 [Ficus carica]|uniref:Uncharacterized protein n=1 Tax=Ficus carica TaxID=3494 RepID=A0AA88D8Z9_FICCA|nr:hypothetical protein TIFTF001_016695 [Ficus carica]
MSPATEKIGVGGSFSAAFKRVVRLPTLKFSSPTHLDIGFLVMVAVCGAAHPLGQI